MIPSILDRLNKLSSSVWMPHAPATAEELATIERALGVVLPTDYRQLMAITNGFGLYAYRTRLYLQSAEDVIWYTEDYREHLPGMFLIGNDEGDNTFYYDPANRLGKGAYAVFMVELGSVGFPYSKHAAAHVTELLEKIIAGESIWDYPHLGE